MEKANKVIDLVVSYMDPTIVVASIFTNIAFTAILLHNFRQLLVLVISLLSYITCIVSYVALVSNYEIFKKFY